MKNMSCFLDLFNSREQSTMIWIVILLLLALSKKDIRKSFLDLIKMLFEPKIITIIGLMLLYTVLIVSILSKMGVWKANLIKDTIFWTFGTAFILMINARKATHDDKYFKTILLDSIKFIIILEFVVNFYTFSFWVELLLMPLLCFVMLIGVVAETEKEHMPVKKVSDFILSGFGLFIIVYSFIKITSNYKELATLDSLRAFILPPLLSFLYIPFLYFFALFMAYELLFVRLDGYINEDKKLAKLAKRKILSLCHINLRMLNRFSTDSTPALVRLSNKADLDNIINEFKK